MTRSLTVHPESRSKLRSSHLSRSLQEPARGQPGGNQGPARGPWVQLYDVAELTQQKLF
ncbi:Hypothetical protein SMAX5B_001884 [Scophthalmus maximus]|uniref:Uncharacterized protein n=1 Tax=Scophthalmus maximus TaxID=52904 RepID=A0A2U9CW88_SCOMX|nr:Hypothetical protein SMAX5B_001884 [Scophthalmus maximus]